MLLPTRKVQYTLVVLGLLICFYILTFKIVSFSGTGRNKRFVKPGIWDETCPSWDPSWPAPYSVHTGSGNQNSTNGRLQVQAQVPSQGTVDRLTSMLQRKLDSVNDVVFPDYSKPCNPNNKTSLVACTSYQCHGQLVPPTLSERVKDILSSPELQLTSANREVISSYSQEFPVADTIILSATSSDHFQETQKMFKVLHTDIYPILKNFTVVLIDLGLTPEEHQRAQRACRCKVIRFPKHLFPDHVQMNYCYSFKPISVLAAMLKARKKVIWMDASVRWTKGLLEILSRSDRVGSQIIRYEGSARTTAHTMRPTFDYLKRPVCAFTTFPEIEACAQIHSNDPVTLRLILEPWAKCALEKCCICPLEPRSVINCKASVVQHRCHRFDQSALTILLGRLLHTDFQKIVMPNSYKDGPILYKLGGDNLNNYF